METQRHGGLAMGPMSVSLEARSAPGQRPSPTSMAQSQLARRRRRCLRRRRPRHHLLPGCQHCQPRRRRRRRQAGQQWRASPRQLATGPSPGTLTAPSSASYAPGSPTMAPRHRAPALSTQGAGGQVRAHAVHTAWPVTLARPPARPRDGRASRGTAYPPPHHRLHLHLRQRCASSTSPFGSPATSPPSP